MLGYTYPKCYPFRYTSQSQFLCIAPDLPLSYLNLALGYLHAWVSLTSFNLPFRTANTHCIDTNQHGVSLPVLRFLSVFIPRRHFKLFIVGQDKLAPLMAQKFPPIYIQDIHSLVIQQTLTMRGFEIRQLLILSVFRS